MAFAGLLFSIGMVIVTGIICFMADCGLTISMIVLLPFDWILEKIFNLIDRRTDEEVLQDALKEASQYRYVDPYKPYSEYVKEAIEKTFSSYDDNNIK